MQAPSRFALQVLLAACLIAVGQKPLDAQFRGPTPWDGYPYVPIHGAPVDSGAAIEIADKPKAIDPATLLPPEMAAKVTLTFEKTPLSEVVTTLSEKLAIDVVLDEIALNDEGIDLDFPVSTRANDEPVYLLVDRMMGRSLAWSIRNGLLRISTRTAEQGRLDTRSYDLSGLLNDGYSVQQLDYLLSDVTSSEWELIDGVGGALRVVGDSLIVSQTDKGHREIAGVLAALRTPARQTLIGQAPQTEQVQAFFKHPITVKFVETPLVEALAALSKIIGSDIQIDELSLEDNGISLDTPITFSLRDKPLHVVLDTLLPPLDLTCVVANAELLVTTTAEAEELMTLALYDVRDLCLSNKTSRQLLEMIQGTTNGEWKDIDGVGGGVAFARPGILLVQQTSPMHDQVFSLIEQLRTLRGQAQPVGERPWERAVETRFYRVTSAAADYLERNLPKLIAPETWRSGERPDAPGTIERITAAPVPVGSPLPPPPKTEKKTEDGNQEKPAVPLVNTVVLAIRQTVDVHEEIPALLHRVKDGDGNYSKWGPCGYGFSQVNEPFRGSPLPLAPLEPSKGAGND
ncbi:MAG: hypothetical protein KF777_08600 [Planctomycetaceae bacterium]|nr:hypothetical protein [Planctomycetaceae bacterium]